MKQRSKKASSRSPRRKAGRAAVRKPNKLTFRLTVDAQEMIVDYKPDTSDSDFAFGRFEFRSPYRKRRGIPVSRTGYLSRFIPMADIKAVGGPKVCAREIVDTILGRSANVTTGQLSLF